MTTASGSDAPISSYDDLFSIFHDAEHPNGPFRIGAEMEKPGVFEKDRSPIPYAGEKSVVTVLEDLETQGWKAEREKEGGPLIALLRDGASITLEPGGQLELSGAPVDDVHAVCWEISSHLKEIAAVSRRIGVRWMGIGFNPFAKREDLPWVPKERYKLMREYLPTRGEYALDMMLRTSTVQANYDYTSEKDAMTKMRVALKLSPLTAAMFANSPWVEGKPFGGVSYRAKAWLDVDNDRSGLVPALWPEDAGYKDYVEWALDVPMFLFKRNGEVFANTGQPFRQFWKDGFKGHKPTQTDWKTHLNTLFPEVRLKNTIEIRSADAQNASIACSLPAVWTGIFYDAQALAAADAMTHDWTHEEVLPLRNEVWKLGLKATFRGEKLAKQALQLLDIADGGLERRAKLNPKGKDERVHTAPLRRLAEKEQTPAEALLERVDPSKELAPQILALTDLEKSS